MEDKSKTRMKNTESGSLIKTDPVFFKYMEVKYIDIGIVMTLSTQFRSGPAAILPGYNLLPVVFH